MAIFKLPDGAKIQINGPDVIRARRTISGESKEAHSRIDAKETYFVVETIDEVSAKIKGELSSFTFITSRDGSKIWFNAKKIVGPYNITPHQTGEGVYKCAIKFPRYRQYATESPEEVRKIIKAAGGTPLSSLEGGFGK